LTFGCTKEELELIKQRKHIHAVKEIKTRTGMTLADAKAVADEARSKINPNDFAPIED
jgi:ribosomal protein L7/L12